MLMQGLCRNRRKVFYANWTGGRTERVDYMGHRLGRYQNVYGPVQEMWVNVSTTSGLTNNNLSGKVERHAYGQQKDYTATINPLPDSCDMDENSVLWVDVVPEIKPDGTTDTPYDHVIVRIAEALNWRACQVQKVDRSGANLS